MIRALPTAIVFPPQLSIGLVLGIELLVVAAALWLFGGWVLARRPSIGWAVSLGRTLSGVIGAVLLVAALLGDPTPQSGLPNPVPDTVLSVSAGAALFQANCAACHGADGRGGGPDAGTTQVPPANLRSGHLDSHSDGDVFYWITNGLPGGMPAWGTKLSTTDRWNLVNFLRSIDGHGPTPGPSAAASGSASAGDSGATGSGAVSAGPGATPGGTAVLVLPVGLGITFGAWFLLPGRRERPRRAAPAR